MSVAEDSVFDIVGVPGSVMRVGDEWIGECCPRSEI
jgi:hypothetical protein